MGKLIKNHKVAAVATDLKLTCKQHPSEGLNNWQGHFYKTVYVSTCILLYLVIKANKPTEAKFEKEYVESINLQILTIQNVFETCEVSKYIQYDVWDTES